MNGLIFRGIEDVRYESTSEPRLRNEIDVVLSLEAAAICGSDLHPYFGRERGIESGTVMGHEAVGTVLEVGSAVEKLRVGDRVVTPFTTSCGQCFYCRKGLTCRCVHGQLYGWIENGHGLEGVQAERVRVPLADSTLVKVPASLRAEEALLLGDVLSTGFFLADMAEAGPEGVYVVVGCGPVGLMAVIGARERGATVYAVDKQPERLALAERYGAHAIDPNEDAVAFIRGKTENRGADGVMEAVGSPATERLAFSLVRPGGTLAVAGVHTAENFSFSPPAAYDKNLTYRVGRCPARAYAERLLPLVESRRYDLAALFSHRVPLAEGSAAYRLFADKRDRCTKVLLTP